MIQFNKILKKNNVKYIIYLDQKKCSKPLRSNIVQKLKFLIFMVEIYTNTEV